MQTDIPDLFVEINYSNYIFVAGIYDDSQNFKIIEKKANKVIWCTTINSEDDELEHQANKYGVYCYRGSELDVLSRFIEVAEKFKSKNIVRVTGDNPLTDPEIIDYLLQKHDESLAEYTYCDNIPVGSRSEIISYNALKYCHKNIQKPQNSEYMTWMLNRNDIFKVNIIKHFDNQITYPNINLTVDTNEEYNNIKTIFNHFENNDFKLKDVVNYIVNNKEIMNKFFLKKSSKKFLINVKYKFEK